MTTRQKLAIAFGTLTALLVLLGVIILFQMRAIQDGLQRQLEVSRPRAIAVRELGTSVNGFELAIRSFLYTGNPVFREDATTAAKKIEKLLADYERAATREKQRGLTARFSTAWQEHRKFAGLLMDSPNGPPQQDDMNLLVAQHAALEKLLEDEMKPDAVTRLDLRLAETSGALTKAVALTLALIVAWVLVALATSVMASRAVLRGEESLRATAHRLRLVTDGSPGLISYIDADYRYQKVNKLWADWFARSHEEVEGRPVREVLKEKAWEFVQPLMARALAGETVNFERQLHHRDGSLRWIETTYTPDHDDAGRVRGFVAHATEITARREAEQALLQALDELQVSEARYRALFEAAPVGIAQGDVQNANFISANPRYCDIVGYTREELHTMNYKQFTHPDDLQPDLDNMQRLLTGDIRHYTMEKRYIRKDGSVVWGSLTVAALWEPGAKPATYMAVVADITARKRDELALKQAKDELEQRVAERTAELLTTNLKLSNEVSERKQAELALRESEERLRFALETSHIGAWDLNLVSMDAHRSLEHDRTFGYTELLPVWTYEMFIEHVLPEDRTAVNEKFQQAVASRGDWDFECRIRRTDGEVRWILAAGRHVIDSTGTTRRMVGIVQDITTRKQAEVALRESEERFRQVTTAIDQVFWMTDAVNRKMLYVSPGYERIWGRPCQSHYDSTRDWLEAIHPDDRDRVFEAAKTKQATGDYDIEYRIARPDGEERWIHDRAFPIRNAAGEVHRIAGISDDITVRKRLLDDLDAASQRERERLGRDLHDGLSQLLVGARLKTDSLVKKLAEQSPENVPRAEAIAALMARAVEESNNLARGLDPVEQVPEGLMSALTRLADTTDRLFGKDCACDFPRPVLVPDHKVATELFRIAQEATNNALKHGEAGTIRIRLAEEPGHLVLTVTNDGKPFPKRPKTAGMGLKTMAFRADRIGATLQISPGPEVGTIVRCALANTAVPIADSATPGETKEKMT